MLRRLRKKIKTDLENFEDRRKKKKSNTKYEPGWEAMAEELAIATHVCNAEAKAMRSRQKGKKVTNKEARTELFEKIASYFNNKITADKVNEAWIKHRRAAANPWMRKSRGGPGRSNERSS